MIKQWNDKRKLSILSEILAQYQNKRSAEMGCYRWYYGSFSSIIYCCYYWRWNNDVDVNDGYDYDVEEEKEDFC